jgi:hypothetical protein
MGRSGGGRGRARQRSDGLDATPAAQTCASERTSAVGVTSAVGETWGGKVLQAM